ncbi:GtrA family protein [Streptomyces sp. NPDC012421]|uniref:GtrA family protein n=1 Tax=Streptomyces sp. NPDC012421 TaxID=3364832 RepID=UPI0036E625BA
MPAARNQQQAAPAAVTSFARFALCGGGVGVAAGFAVTALGTWIPWVLANALVTVVSTVLSTELHARFTFGTGGRATRRQHAQSAGSAAAAYAVTCLAMFVLEHLVAAPDAMLRQTVYLAASALSGMGRFTVLRALVFARHRSRTTTSAPEATPRPLRAVTANTSAPVDRAALRRAA